MNVEKTKTTKKNNKQSEYTDIENSFFISVCLITHHRRQI